MLLLLDELMSRCAAGTNGCLDLRRRAFAPGGQASAESQGLGEGVTEVTSYPGLVRTGSDRMKEHTLSLSVIKLLFAFFTYSAGSYNQCFL